MADYIVGITGASGSIYGVRLVQELLKRNNRTHVIVTRAGEQVIAEEMGRRGMGEIDDILRTGSGMSPKIWRNDDFTAPFMSGSNDFRAVVIIPCSVGKLAAIASGLSSNLLERTADVALKERRPLILVVRETPLNLIHLQNMVTIARAGAHILPAMPAFYYHPKTVDDMVNFIVAKVLNLLGIEHDLLKGWKSE